MYGQMDTGVLRNNAPGEGVAAPQYQLGRNTRSPFLLFRILQHNYKFYTTNWIIQAFLNGPVSYL